MKKVQTATLILSGALWLSACSGLPIPQREMVEEPTRAPVVTVSGTPSGTATPLVDIPGETAGSVEIETDGLEGGYYNDYLRMLLVLDGAGGFTLSGAGVDEQGAYTVSQDGWLTLKANARQETALIDETGDITIEGRTGYFLHNWDFWGITAAETGSIARSASPITGSVENGDGTWRYRDFENSVAFTYGGGVSVQRGMLSGAAVAGDDNGAYVTGRNVTDLYYTHNGSADEFLEDYMKDFVFSDFGLLYGAVEQYQDYTLHYEDAAGRLARATLTLEGNRQTVAVELVLYTSTFPDGTVNYICKTVFVPDNDDTTLTAMAEAVWDMGALRLRQEM